jgi:hypothetical protein
MLGGIPAVVTLLPENWPPDEQPGEDKVCEKT